MRAITPLDASATLDFDVDGVALIEASAGTGKTYTIANLYLRHLLDGRRPAEILVVSFTNAATDELLQRIQARARLALQCFEVTVETDDAFLQLLTARFRTLDQAEQEQWRLRLVHALRGMDEAAISTIHGFCQTALRDHALLCNQPFEATVIANDDAYWERALKDWWRRRGYPLSAAQWSVFSQALPGLDLLLRWQRELRLRGRMRVWPHSETDLLTLIDTCPDADDPARPAALDRIRARALVEAHREAGEQVAREKDTAGEIAYQDQLDALFDALSGAHGERLAKNLRERFPVAMIDEFQDTDDTQFGIFERLYFGQSGSSLILIGDPKQAIYSFRGSDIFTYMRARRAHGVRIHSLRTNRRSTAELIDAVNRVFGARDAAFVYQDDIRFEPTAPPPDHPVSRIERDGNAVSAMTLWHLPRQPNGKVFPLNEMRPRVCRAVAGEIRGLLDPASEIGYDGRPLQPGDIAVLVRRRDEGDAIRSALEQAGIASVTVSRESVLRSAEARGLLDLLEGIAHCDDATMLRRARASSLFASDHRELDQALNLDDNWQAWIDILQALRQRWSNAGFIAMFQMLHTSLALGPRLAARDQAERRLTNLGQLGEILQRQSRRSPGVESLLAWYRRQIEQDYDEENELRLESDGDLVKIVTIHRSKGLEYPVVFVPFPWLCRQAGYRPEWLRFQVDGETRFSVAREDFETQRPLAEKERLAEDLRLLYVALTRARAKLYLAWGTAGSGNAAGLAAHSALGWLLHSPQSPADLDRDPPQAFDNTADLADELERLARDGSPIEVRDLPEPVESGPLRLAAAAATSLQARVFRPDSLPAWRIGSFTGLTRDVHQVDASAQDPAVGDPVPGDPLPGDPVQGDPVQGDPILDFPAGSHIGLLLHELLEHLDFRHPSARLAESIAALAPIHGLLHEQQQRVLADWIAAIVDTDLDGDGLRLARLAPHRRLNELAFVFAIDTFDLEAINQWLQSQTAQPLQPLTGADFRGLITGIIDLVFEFDGRYYLADYKSNHLGSTLDDYRPACLARTMLDRRYDFQSWLYTLALHRYLQQRLPDYDYATHFGGCYYLFLRAMRPQHGPRYGVHFSRPALEQLQALERLLRTTAPGEAQA